MENPPCIDDVPIKILFKTKTFQLAMFNHQSTQYIGLENPPLILINGGFAMFDYWRICCSLMFAAFFTQVKYE